MAVTLIADVFVEGKISAGIYLNEFNAGLTQEKWDKTMILSDINFWLVFILGFVVYVIWGFLLHYVLSHPYMKSKNEKIKLMVEHVDNKIKERRKEHTVIAERIHKLESDIQIIDNKITENEKDIIGYENGTIVSIKNLSSLRRSIGEFMGGWENYTNNKFSISQTKNLIASAIKYQEEWKFQKLSNLKSID